MEELKAISGRIQKKAGDLAGTFTAMVIEQSKTFLEVREEYQQGENIPNKIKVLLRYNPTDEAPPGGYPYVRADPLSRFVFAQYVELLKNHTEETNRILNGFQKDENKRRMIEAIRSIISKMEKSGESSSP